MAPWYLKIPLKMVLARLPVPRSLFNRMGVFRHGGMRRPDYALEIVQRHTAFAQVDLARKHVLELGPGDSVGNGIVAYALGAHSTCLVDAGDWATRDLGVYRAFVDWLVTALPDPTRLRQAGTDWGDFDGLLRAFNMVYRTDGLAALRGLPAQSIDYCFSEAVLEHIRLHEFDASIAALRQVLRPGAVTTHTVDYKDHLQASLHNMRFSPKRWESPLFADSGFYTNRLRHGDVMASFERAGWQAMREERMQWPALPMARARIHPQLRHHTDADLRVHEAFIAFRAPEQAVQAPPLQPGVRR